MKAISYFIISTIFWGLNFHLAKVMLAQANFIEAGFWRYLFGVIPLTLLASKALPSWPEIVKNLKGISLVGIIGIFGFNLFFFMGMMSTSAINAVLIFSLNPILTLIISNRILKTSINYLHILGILISVIGVAYLLSKGSLENLYLIEFSYGDIFIFTGTIFFALHHVWVKKYAVSISNTNFTLLTAFLCMICFVLLLPFVGMQSPVNYTLYFWLSAIGIGVFGTALAYYAWNKGIKLTDANQAGMFINITPLFTALFAVFFGETLYFYHGVSGLLIILGVLIMKFDLTKKYI